MGHEPGGLRLTALQIAYLVCVLVGIWLFLEILDALPVLKLVLVLLGVVMIALGIGARINRAKQEGGERRKGTVPPRTGSLEVSGASRVLEFPDSGGLLAEIKDQPARGRISIASGELSRLTVNLSWGGNRPGRDELERAVEPFCRALRQLPPMALDEVSLIAARTDETQQGVLGKQPQQAILEALSGLLGLRDLALGGNQWASGLSLKSDSAFVGVRCLFMAGPALFSLLPRFKGVRNLELRLLSEVAAADQEARSGLLSLEALSELEELSVSDCPDITWLPNMRRFTRLRRLALANLTNVSGQASLIEQLGAVPSLRELILPFWPQPPQAFLESGVLGWLETLAVPFPRSRPTELFALLAKAAPVRALTDLGGFTEPYPAGFREAVASMPHLRQLNLHDLEFTDDLWGLLQIPTLEELILRGCVKRDRVPAFRGWSRLDLETDDLMAALQKSLGIVHLRRALNASD